MHGIGSREYLIDNDDYDDKNDDDNDDYSCKSVHFQNILVEVMGTKSMEL